MDAISTMTGSLISTTGELRTELENVMGQVASAMERVEGLSGDAKSVRDALADTTLSLDETIALLSRLNLIKPVWVELGLQTIHEKTAEFIRRGYPLPVFEDTFCRLKAAGLTVVVHVILGLPGESREDMLATVRYLSKLHVDGIKLQLLHVLKGTDLNTLYEAGVFKTLELSEYLELVGACLKLLPPDTVIHRISGDGPKALLTAPLWSGNKRLVLNSMTKYLKENHIIQGQDFTEQQ